MSFCKYLTVSNSYKNKNIVGIFFSVSVFIYFYIFFLKPSVEIRNFPTIARKKKRNKGGHRPKHCHSCLSTQLIPKKLIVTTFLICHEHSHFSDLHGHCSIFNIQIIFINQIIEDPPLPDQLKKQLAWRNQQLKWINLIK